MSYDAPFVGIKVVDLSQGIAAPYAGMLLAQYGASVIKVEVLDGGDWVRVSAAQPGGNTALSVMGNLGKRSIAVDLKSPDGCAILWRLLKGADVFMEGFRTRERPARLLPRPPRWPPSPAPWATGGWPCSATRWRPIS
jgi:crotonobetainyl-CoA:carnitine CoA-transferase CaiB-like acyl-CoA transferase